MKKGCTIFLYNPFLLPKAKYSLLLPYFSCIKKNRFPVFTLAKKIGIKNDIAAKLNQKKSRGVSFNSFQNKNLL